MLVFNFDQIVNLPGVFTCLIIIQSVHSAATNIILSIFSYMYWRRQATICKIACKLRLLSRFPLAACQLSQNDVKSNIN